MSEKTQRKPGDADAGKSTAGKGKPSGRDEATSHANGPRNARTSGTDRDFDESGAGKNQGHGHPREERGGS